MKTYHEFHGNIPSNEIGKKLREILKLEKKSFKIMTGYGSSSGTSKSKIAAIKSLASMKRDGLIQGFFPGEVKHQVLSVASPYHDSKIKFENIVKQDSDYGNDGIIFVFVL